MYSTKGSTYMKNFAFHQNLMKLGESCSKYEVLKHHQVLSNSNDN